MSRRHFLAVASGATLATMGGPAFGQAIARKRFQILGFTKPFQQLTFEETADIAAEVGWDGIECPVRAKGQILPERVEEDLPQLVAALKKRNVEVSILATDVQDATHPLTQKVLRTASRLGVKKYRLGFMRYREDQPVLEQLHNLRAALRDLVALNLELGLHAGFQNHSGEGRIGAPVWDIFEVIRELDPKYIGIFFDIGHATLEGGYSWPTQARLMQPFMSAVYVKDFVWQKTPKGWQANWCPLGEGTVHREFFQRLRKSTFAGPISQHYEYELGQRPQMIRAMKKDLQVLQEWLTGGGEARRESCISDFKSQI
jgi:sugar phosphate isomerase/epimerase